MKSPLINCSTETRPVQPVRPGGQIHASPCMPGKDETKEGKRKKREGRKREKPEQ